MHPNPKTYVDGLTEWHEGNKQLVARLENLMYDAQNAYNEWHETYTRALADWKLSQTAASVGNVERAERRKSYHAGMIDGFRRAITAVKEGE